ncbi:reverse transcriptase domain-containing protein [Tanacetum coccineum]
MNERCSAVLLNELPSKVKDPKSFTVPCQELEKHKEAEDLAAYHLSRFENSHMEVLSEREIADKFSDDHLMVLKAKSNNNQPCETLEILAHCHSGPTGGHHSANVTAKKVYEFEFYWPSVFKDANEYILWDHFPNLELFARFGVPKALISDRGTHFCNSQLEKDLQIYGVTHKLSIVYHPQSNGQTEVTNRAIKRILERSVGYNPKGWSKKLKDALWAFRTAYKTSTRCTPFRLVYGKACHLPVEIEHKAHWALKQCNMDLTLASESRLMHLNELAELRDGAYENTRIYKERTKKWVYPYGAVEIIDKNKFSFKVNRQRLKKYYKCNTDKEDDEVIEFENGVM